MDTQKIWRVTWELEIIKDPGTIPAFNSPNVNVFRLTFSSAEEAAQFIAEIQRYLGGIVNDLVSKGIQLRLKP